MSKLKYIDLTEEEKTELVESYNVTGTNEVFADKFGVSARTIQKWKASVIKERGLSKTKLAKKNAKKNTVNQEEKVVTTKQTVEEKYDILSHDKRTIKRLENENKVLRKAINEAKEEIVTSDDIKQLIAEAKEIGFDTTEPVWLKKAKKSDDLIPVMALSDIHIGEVIKAEEMGYGDSYDTETAHAFADKVTQDFINICKVNMSNYNYKGIVLLLPGDGITGSLHDLSDTNDRTPVQQVVELTNLYTRVIRALRKEFDKVAVFGVTGNHGRFDARAYTKTKGRVENSLETIVYHFVQEAFADDAGVSMVTNKTDEILFAINGRKFLLCHGDNVKGGNGIGGIHVPIMRTRAKMLSVKVANNQAFDTLILGHFHQHFLSSELVICNSLKPYDEYSKAMNFSYSRPGSTTFFVNHRGQMIYATDVQINKEDTITPSNKKSIELF